MAALKSDGEEDSAVCELDGSPFAIYYGQLQHQQNMLQDYMRTGAYQQAILQNTTDFAGSTVLDVCPPTWLPLRFPISLAFM